MIPEPNIWTVEDHDPPCGATNPTVVGALLVCPGGIVASPCASNVIVNPLAGTPEHCNPGAVLATCAAVIECAARVDADSPDTLAE